MHPPSGSLDESSSGGRSRCLSTRLTAEGRAPSTTMPRLKKVTPLEPSLCARGRRASTAVAMEYPMWVMPVSELLRLSEMRPHEELREERKIVECDLSHTTVFYISHQWTSENHPDDSTTQLRALQTLMLRMQRGELPEAAPTFVDAVRLPPGVTINSKAWKTLVADAFIWLDYVSVRNSGSLTSHTITSRCQACVLRCFCHTHSTGSPNYADSC